VDATQAATQATWLFGSPPGTTFTYTTPAFDSQYSRCEDTVDGTRNDHPLSITHIRKDISFLGGSSNDTIPGVFVNERSFAGKYPAFYGGYTPSHCDYSSLLPADAASRTLARTNPSRPVANLPVIIGELKDFPALFKLTGETFLKKGANAYLSYQYGWRPFLSDLSHMFNFHQGVARRAVELDRLYGNGGLKRRIPLASGTITEDLGDFVIDSSASVNLWGHMTRATTVEQYATVRWLPTALPTNWSHDRLEIARSVYFGAGRGTSFDGFFVPLVSNLWQVMPWSWLADWFSSVGDVLNAGRNSIPATHAGLNVMTHVKTLYTASRVNKGWPDTYFGGGVGTLTVESKIRSQPSASLAADIPILSGFQLSILGALGIQRLRRH